jgi:hypothetical protein
MKKLFWRFGYLHVQPAHMYKAWFVSGGRYIRLAGRLYIYLKG